MYGGGDKNHGLLWWGLGMNMVMIMMLMMAMMKVMVMVMMMMVMMMITPADRPRVPSGIGRCSFKAPRRG